MIGDEVPIVMNTAAKQIVNAPRKRANSLAPTSIARQPRNSWRHSRRRLRSACTPAPGEKDVVRIVKDGIVAAQKERARTVIVNTAGRLQIDEEMMNELRRLKSAVSPAKSCSWQTA